VVVASSTAVSSDERCAKLSPATAVSAAPAKKRAVKATVVAARRMRGFGCGLPAFGLTASSRGGAPPNSQLSLCDFRRGIAW
jgi:hypothetical protein